MSGISKEVKEAALKLTGWKLKEGFKPAGLHEYTDPTGVPLYWRIRLKHPDTGKKEIFAMRPNGKGYILKEPEFHHNKPLYRLHTLASSGPVVVCEGETCVNALARIGIIATTSGSSSSAAGADWQPLAGKPVVIWPDNDAWGQSYARDVREKLSALGCTLKTIDVSALDLPEKGDAVDWLRAHPDATAGDIFALPTVETATATAGDDGWPEPIDLPDSQPPVLPFKTLWLPPALKPFVEDTALRNGAPPEFVAVPLMVTLGSLIGRKVGIYPRERDTGWKEFANLWGAVIAEPGTKKTPAMNAALKLLSPFIAQADEEHKAASIEHARAMEAHGLRMEQARKCAKAKLADDPSADVTGHLRGIDEPTAPAHRRFVTDNCTASALTSIIVDNPNGFLIKRDELVTLLKQVERDDAQDLRSLLLSGADGNTPVTDDTVKHGCRHVDAVTLSLFGSAQPDAIGPFIDRLLQSGGGGDGLLQRFGLLVWPDAAEGNGLDTTPDADAERSVAEIVGRLVTLDPSTVGTYHPEQKYGLLHFDREAQELFRAWETELHSRLRDTDHSAALRSHLAKQPKTVCALALIYHLVQNRGGDVQADALHYAIEWHRYLSTHANRVYRSGKLGEVEAARCIVDHIRKGDLPDEFTARAIERKHWGQVQKDSIRDALILLADYNYIRPVSIDAATLSKGRPRGERFEASPRLRT